MFKLFCVSAALMATAAMAQTPPGTAAKDEANADPEEVICVIQKGTGSRLDRTRVCRTRAEWAALRAEHRNAIEPFQGRTPSTSN
jgi:hypothetical protein